MMQKKHQDGGSGVFVYSFNFRYLRDVFRVFLAVPRGALLSGLPAGDLFDTCIIARQTFLCFYVALFFCFSL